MTDQRKSSFLVTAKYIKSVEKMKKKGYVLNWSNPQRHVDHDLLRFIFKSKIGIDIPRQEYYSPFTIEELAYCFDKLGLLEEENE